MAGLLDALKPLFSSPYLSDPRVRNEVRSRLDPKTSRDMRDFINAVQWASPQSEVGAALPLLIGGIRAGLGSKLSPAVREARRIAHFLSVLPAASLTAGHLKSMGRVHDEALTLLQDVSGKPWSASSSIPPQEFARLLPSLVSGAERMGEYLKNAPLVKGIRIGTLKPLPSPVGASALTDKDLITWEGRFKSPILGAYLPPTMEVTLNATRLAERPKEKGLEASTTLFHEAGGHGADPALHAVKHQSPFYQGGTNALSPLAHLWRQSVDRTRVDLGKAPAGVLGETLLEQARRYASAMKWQEADQLMGMLTDLVLDKLPMGRGLPPSHLAHVPPTGRTDLYALARPNDFLAESAAAFYKDPEALRRWNREVYDIVERLAGYARRGKIPRLPLP